MENNNDKLNISRTAIYKLPILLYDMKSVAKSRIP